MKPQIYTDEHRFFKGKLNFAFYFNPVFICVYLCKREAGWLNFPSFREFSCLFVAKIFSAQNFPVNFRIDVAAADDYTDLFIFKSFPIFQNSAQRKRARRFDFQICEGE